jgi:hypothetical protein
MILSQKHIISILIDGIVFADLLLQMARNTEADEHRVSSSAQESMNVRFDEIR